jgi:serine O-acetyltransferase
MTWRDDLRMDLGRRCNRSFEAAITLIAVRASRTSGWPRWLAAFLDPIVVRGIFGTEIHPEAVIGPGLGLPHGARGLVVHPAARIGANCMIFHRVTLAANAHGAPVLGNDVLIGTGACVIGPVRIGARARIGANAVVIKDVPDGALVYSEASMVVR